MLFRVLSCVAFLLVCSSVVFALEPDQVFSKVAKSIVLVEAEDASDGGSQGSGVIIAPGEIVTNCHVVENAKVISVARGEFRSIAQLRYVDTDRDLCQITVKEKRGFGSVVLVNKSVSELRVGQKVYAIGAPQGLDLTLSDGLISSIRDTGRGSLIQTTAPISPGSSGGGLFDSDGRLIGITTFIFRRGQNLNFAIPASWIADLPSRNAEITEQEKSLPESAHAEMFTEWDSEDVSPTPTLPEHLRWIWPSRGSIVYDFGSGGNAKGIGIRGRLGDSIVASEEGKVVYSGTDLRGYGLLIIIKHGVDYLSVYAHNSRLLTREGQIVTQGQKIAEMGDTALDASTPILHFEIRLKGRPVNPIPYLSIGD